MIIMNFVNGKNNKMNLEQFVIHKSATIVEALKKIELNHNGFVLIHDFEKKIIGIATDGDIRRRLLNNPNLEDSILECANVDFIKAQNDTPREKLLKQLDSKIKAIPILNEKNELESIVTRDFIPERVQQKVYARSKSPVRISFGGGGSDISAYFSENKAAVINATISLYSHATLKIRDDDKIILNSLDLNDKIEFENIIELQKYDGRFSLIKSVIKAINPSFGFELFVHSDFPMSSGLGGSAVVTSSILGCFNQFRNDKWDKHDISEIAFQAERLHLGVAGGWQDQYATVFGGLNFMEFNKEQNIINPIRLNNETILELEESLVLCYTGTIHDSGNIHNDQKEQTKKEDVKDRIQSNVDLTFEMRNHLLRGRLNDFGHCLHKAWELKRSFSSKISTPWLDEIYDGAIQNGAIGGKLLGAGGGGYFLFYVPSFDRHTLINWIKSKGLFATPFIFENNGMQSWTVREINNK
jgi:D-glycero-alpha-D-manno-heptose-7-phosphate kinase